MVERSEIEDILERGIDFKNRRIYFGSLGSGHDSSINWNTVELVIRAIHKLSADHPKKPIELHMSSPGGDIAEAFRLYDTIQSCSCQIKFYGAGEIMSAALLVMAGSDERYLAENSCLMFHSIQLSSGEESRSFINLEIDQKEILRLNNKWLELISNNSRMPVDFWADLSQRDLYLTAEEALQLGLADHIIPRRKRGALRKRRTYALGQTPSSSELSKLVRSLYARVGQGKRVGKIEVLFKKEDYDPHLEIDTSPVSLELGHQAMVNNIPKDE